MIRIFPKANYFWRAWSLNPLDQFPNGWENPNNGFADPTTEEGARLYQEAARRNNNQNLDPDDSTSALTFTISEIVLRQMQEASNTDQADSQSMARADLEHLRGTIFFQSGRRETDRFTIKPENCRATVGSRAAIFRFSTPCPRSYQATAKFGARRTRGSNFPLSHATPHHHLTFPPLLIP